MEQTVFGEKLNLKPRGPLHQHHHDKVPVAGVRVANDHALLFWQAQKCILPTKELQYLACKRTSLELNGKFIAGWHGNQCHA